MSHRDVSIALRRFGLGARRGDPARLASDPRGYVLAALSDKGAAAIFDPDLEPSHRSLQDLREAQRAERAARNRRPAPPEQSAGPPNAAMPASELQRSPAAEVAQSIKPSPRDIEAKTPKPGEVRREVFREEARARLERAVGTDAPFLERLVYFWSNHFCVSALKGQMVRVLAGGFEREAIRPHVLGRFADMLKAVEQHPAMLFYLDNVQSIGPGSVAGRNRGKGLNENLAREIMELHTLGADGGYTQADVTSFAAILTGWSVADPQLVSNAAANPKLLAALAGQQIVPGRFVFTPHRHEPGMQQVLGKRYDQLGVLIGEQVLVDLARHPATARHIATKLSRHFVSHKPPPGLVERLTATFLNTDGDLQEVARTLATSAECWDLPPAKVMPPFDFIVSLMRAFDWRCRAPEANRISAALGQSLWAPPSPKGWPDEDDSWMGPSVVRERLRIAERVAREIDHGLDPRLAAAELFGDALSPQARQAIERAEAREQGFELLIMSPGFMRR